MKLLQRNLLGSYVTVKVLLYIAILLLLMDITLQSVRQHSTEVSVEQRNIKTTVETHSETLTPSPPENASYCQHTFREGIEEVQTIGNKAGTDKTVSSHRYQNMYGKYLPDIRAKARAEQRPVKFLEIGLGCNMQYGPGKSVQLWKEFFEKDGGKLELHEVEIDRACVEKWESKLNADAVTVHIGDTGSREFLEKVVVDTVGNPSTVSNLFDVVVDDGGHYFEQNIAAFEVLFQQILKPGGLYFLEDIAPFRPGYENSKCKYCDGKTVDYFKPVLETVVGLETNQENQHPEGLCKRALNVFSMDSFKNAMVFRKGTDHDCEERQMYCFEGAKSE